MEKNTITNYRFKPVQCSDDTFQTLSPINGNIYFVTDKKKIFLGKDGNMIPMCASSGFFYGTKEISYDNSGIEPDPNVTFYFEEIEGEEIPEKNDLILNTDGCFYRIMSVYENSLSTKRLTLQGTGGGSVSGGGLTGAEWSLSSSNGKNLSYAKNAKTMSISFKGNFDGDPKGNVIASIALKRKDDAEPFFSVYNNYDFNTTHSIDIVEYKNLFSADKGTEITLFAYDIYGYERSVDIKIQLIDLELEKSENNIIKSFSDVYTYKCKISGATSGITSKKITYSIYNENDLSKPLLEKVKILNVLDDDEIHEEINLASLDQGVYVLKVTASVKIPNVKNDLPSNTLSHKIAYFKQESDTPLLAVYVSDTTEQYTNIPVEYIVLSNKTNQQYQVNFDLSGKNEASLTALSNVLQEHPLYFEKKGTYTLTVTVVELNLVFNTYLTISEYTGYLPVIDTSRNDLALYLNPKGKSNTSIDKDKWADYNKKYTGTLTNFTYGKANGWLADEKGIEHLKLSSGAKFEMSDFRPFEKDPTKENALDSKMGSGFTIEIDFEVNGVLDYDNKLISCLSTDIDGAEKVGFYITGDKISFCSNRTKLMSLNYVEGKRTKVSFVVESQVEGKINYPMAYAYLNGKISGATILNGDSFEDGVQRKAHLKIDSSVAQIKIYGIRFYTSALSDRVILNNYTATLPTLEEKQIAYDSNNVYDSAGKISYLKLLNEEYDLRIPCMFLTGGYATETESKWQRKDISDNSARLPFGKKDYRMVDVKVIYPKVKDPNNSNDPNLYFNGYRDYEFINRFDSGKTMALAYGEKPNNGGAIMYAQGTSSMEYPVKNLRLRFKNESDWFKVRPDISPVEIICMKADYMESSGSHNTGSANLIDALYQGTNLKTPGQKELGGDGKDTIVTCIKGHPCLIFYSSTGEEGSYEYIGKYNLNLDKATPKPFGFDHLDNFGWLHPGDTYFAIKYGDEKETFVGQEKPDESGDYQSSDGEIEKEVQDGEKINSIHCFEFLDNAVEVCNFLEKYKEYIKDPETGELIPNPAGETYSYEESWYNTFKNNEGKNVPGWALGFESRYPEDRIGTHDADSLYPLASWLNELHKLRLTGDSGEKKAISRFKNEYQCYLNKEFTLIYYLYTEALLMADSRVKNMMIATWGKENYGEGGKGTGTKDKYSYYKDYLEQPDGSWIPDTNSERVYTNNYIFYPIFYDMDTMLGLDNTGVYRFNYYDEDINPSIFNGEEVLWTFVRDALGEELPTQYNNLEAAALTENKVLPYFNTNQANLANEAFYNGDSKYKYINPARNGYHDDLYDKDIAAGVGPYLYAAQGDRSLMREWFLSNRLRFLRGKYKSLQFKGGDRIEYRQYYPEIKNGKGPDEFIDQNGVDHSESIKVIPPSVDFQFSSIRTGYAGIQIGANASQNYIERFNGEESKEIKAPEAKQANGTEAYLLGLSNLSDLGDLSDKYMQKFIIGSDEIHLKNLTLGNANKHYYNPYWATVIDGQSSTIGLSNAFYLETFNLYNCVTFNNVLNFGACSAIQRILLTGSGVSGLILPDGGVLKELRLPTTVTELTIKNHNNLKDFSLGVYAYDESSENKSDHYIGYGNGKFVNDYSKIKTLEIVDTPIDTYSIVKDAIVLEKYCLKGINWTITEEDSQYCYVPNSNDLPAEKIKNCYIYNNEDNSYTLYGEDFYPTNGKSLFEKIDMINEGKIVCIPVLEQLLTKTPVGDNVTGHAEALTGEITIDIQRPGSGKYSVDELDIYNRYKEVFPNIVIKYSEKIDVTEAYKIKFYYTDYNALPDTGVENLTPYFEILTKGEETLSALTQGLTSPNKSQTATKTYIFTGQWVDVNTNIKYLQDGYTNSTEENVVAFSDCNPISNMNLVPVFSEIDRIYEINFYNYDYKNSETRTPLLSLQAKYGETLGKIVSPNSVNEAKTKYQYRPSDNFIGEFERYAFKGWINENDYNNDVENPECVDLNDLTVNSEFKLFAYYKIEDITKIQSDLSIFRIEGTTISIKENYKNLVGGKITLPSVYNNTILTTVGNFSGTSITGIYFLEDAKYTTISKDSCKDMYSLKKFDFPNTITTIGEQAFQISVSTNNVLEISYLPTNLTTLGPRAFANQKNISISKLPNSLKEIGEQCFSNCQKVGVTDFSNDGLTIGYQAFYGAGKNISETRIIIGEGVKLIPKNRFSDEDLKYQTFNTGYTSVSYIEIPKSAISDWINKNGEESLSELSYDLFGRYNNTVSIGLKD